MRGKYICIEGADGSGKTTLVNALSEVIDGREQRFPSDGHVGRVIRSALRGEIELDPRSFLYLFCADGFEQQPFIEVALAAGAHVLCDRHPTLSGRIYQKQHHKEPRIEAVYGAANGDGLRFPDFLFVLDAPGELLFRRAQTREKYKDVVFEQSKVSYFESVRQDYLKLADKYGAVVLDAELSIEKLVGFISIYVESHSAQTTQSIADRFDNDCG